MNEFVHLHLHSEFSLLDGACRIADIPKAAKKEGHHAVAITDHGAMYGVVAFYKACVDEGIKPIIGCEVYVAPNSRFNKSRERDSVNSHLVLLVKNEIGYRNLIYMVSKAYTEGFYSKPRVDMELLEAHSEGLVAMSACLGGYIPRCITAGNIKEADAHAMKLKEIFGKDNFYLELQDHGIPEQKIVNNALVSMAERLDIGLAATNDVHYLEKADAETQAILLCIQTNNVITNGRPIGFESDEFYYKSTDEMRELFGKYKDALSNTVKIADMCNFEFEFGKIHLPRYKPESELSPEEYLKKLSYDGFSSRIQRGHIKFDEKNSEEVYRERIEYELSVIFKMGYSEYYLIVWDFVNHAKSQGIPVGPGRGSGAGSLVAYLVGITDIDPIKFDLLFERFLNPERVSMPDFDIDFCYDRRDEAIEYVREKYGTDHTSQIITFGTMAARAAVRDVGRALGMSYADVDPVAKMIPQELKMTLKKALEGAELKELYESSPQVKKLIDTAAALEGMPRHASTHAAGVVITEKTITEYLPLAVNNGIPVTQFSMETVAELGLLKFDFLALRYLTIISNAEKLICEREPDFDISLIPIDDAESFQLISEGHTDGVFQLESGGIRQMLMQLKPESLNDIIAAISLYRPGPMDSIPKYIESRHDKDKITYRTPLLEPILNITYGCIVYQEQVMQIFREIADYSYGRADIVRRAMAKKKESAMEQERDDFIKGAKNHGIDNETASALFDDMASFAKYAFNKSHAAAYAVISYRTAYLKVHYPCEYISALLTSVIDNPLKISEYMTECQRYNVEVLPPDINESYDEFHTTADGNIRFGLLGLKNVGRQFVKNIVSERKKGKFESFEEFINRMSAYDLNKRSVEMLIKSGAFDRLGNKRSQLLHSYEEIIDMRSAYERNNLSGQLDLFSMQLADESEPQSMSGFIYPDIDEYTPRELLALEKESSGLYFSGHMLDNYTKNIELINPDMIADIFASFEKYDDEEADISVDNIKYGKNRYSDNQKVTVAGIITRRTDKSTKNGDRMAFITLEDRNSEIEIVVFPRILSKYSDTLTIDNVVSATGTLSVKEEESPKILLEKSASLYDNDSMPDKAEIQSNQVNNVSEIKEKKKPRLFIKIDREGSKMFNRIVSLVDIFSGDTEVIFYDSQTQKYVKSENLRAVANDFLIKEISELIGAENVILK